MDKDTFEIQFSHIINTNSPQTAIKILLPIINEIRYQAKQSDEVCQRLSLQIKQMELDKNQLQLDYDKLLMRITAVESAPSK